MTVSEILTIGDELLDGSKTNTNASWLAKTLSKNGVKVRKIITVGDHPPSISEEIERAVEEEVDLLIVTGGLGPTPDDRTLDALSQALKKDRILDQRALESVRESYSKLAEKGVVKEEGITPSRRKMAELPRGSIPLFNPVGGAPAVLSEVSETKILCLPGVPREMKAILKQNLDLLELPDKNGGKFHRKLEIKGTEESALAPLFEELQNNFRGAEVRSYPIGRGAEGKIVVKLSEKNEGRLNQAESFLRRKVEDMDGELSDSHNLY